MPARAAKKSKAGGGGAAKPGTADFQLAQWTQRQIHELLQCTPEETQMCAANILSMPLRDLEAFCDSTLTPMSPAEQRLDVHSRFYHRFLGKKEELGLLQQVGQKGSTSGTRGRDDDTASVVSAAASVAPSTAASTSVSGAAGKKKSRNKFTKSVEMAGEGKEAIIPVAQFCGCEGRKHELICNCQVCGKIVCAQEGDGPCFFCFSELMREPAHTKRKAAEATDVEQKEYLDSQREFLRAVGARDRLLKYQSERAQRTEVKDDQEDYYESSNSSWLTAAERAEQAAKEEKLRDERREKHRKGGAYAMHIDVVAGVMEQGLKYSASQQTKQELVAPADAVDGGKAADEELESGNIHMSRNVYIPEVRGPIAVRADADDLEDAAGACTAESALADGGVRALRCPDAAAAIVYHPGAQLQQLAVAQLRGRYAMDDVEAERHTDYLRKAPSIGEVRQWAAAVARLPGVSDPAFTDWVNAAAEELGLQRHRWSSAGVDGAAAEATDGDRAARAKGLAKPDAGVIAASTGRIQTEWDADVPAEGAAAARPRAGFPSASAEREAAAQQTAARLQRSPWVKVNSAVARQRDLASKVKLGGVMCLSMHQPWASLLVTGVKKHEGRTWETSHRGRMWIHAAAHQPSDDDIRDTENFYRSRGASRFPTHYPTSALLGCVTVDGCMDSDAYRAKLPAEEQESSSEWVFLCSNPQVLVLPLPMDGQHKIFQLSRSVIDSVKRQAGREM